MSSLESAGQVLSRVTPDDHRGLRAIQAIFDGDTATWALLEGAPPRRDEARELVGELPPGVTPDRKHVWVAEGTCVIDLVEGFPEARTWYLGLIFIAPSARGAGLGTRLLRALFDHVRAHGGTALRLAVAATNADARRLYDRLGFAQVARKQRPLWIGGTHEVDVMELAL